MKPMLTAFIAIAVIAIGANVALQYSGFSAAEQGSGNDVRLSN